MRSLHCSKSDSFTFFRQKCKRLREKIFNIYSMEFSSELNECFIPKHVWLNYFYHQSANKVKVEISNVTPAIFELREISFRRNIRYFKYRIKIVTWKFLDESVHGYDVAVVMSKGNSNDFQSTFPELSSSN